MGKVSFARRGVREPVLSAAAVWAVAALLIATHAAAPLQRWTADALVRLVAASPLPAPPGIPDVALVALDPQSLRAIPDWPWPRRIYAEAIERLDAAGAKAIAIDIDFSTPRDAGDDAVLTEAVRSSGAVVLATFRQQQLLPGGGELEIANLPFPALERSAAALGSVLMPLDPDGVVRRAPRGSEIAGRPLGSLAAAALAVAQRTPVEVKLGFFEIDYRRAYPAPPVVSMIDLLEGRFDSRDVAGRVVMIGATAAEFQDLWSTPLGPIRPGVWIQALAYRTLAAERAGASVFATASLPVQLGLVAVLALVSGHAGRRRSHAQRLLLLGLLATGLLGGIVAWVSWSGLLVDPVVPCGAIAAQYVLGLEQVRRRIGRRLADRDQSLVALHQVGEATSGAAAGDSLGVALALLGDVVGAVGVALLRADHSGALDGRRVEWHGSADGNAIGDEAIAAAVLESREARVVQGLLPGGAAGLVAYAPLFASETPVGVLMVERAGASPLDATQHRTIATVGTQLALSVENLQLIDRLRSTLDASVEAIASAVEARDGYTEMHCRRLALFSVHMAHRLGLSDEEIEAIRLGALLHDVGKIGVRDEILLKPGKFSPVEMEEMKSHAVIGHRIIGSICGLEETTLHCVRHHHEAWDGSGYPDGLAGGEIPLGARIVSVVDVWDALSTARPYKPAYDQEQVRSIMFKGRGTRFDPDLIALFFEILDEEGEEMLAFVSGAGALAEACP